MKRERARKISQITGILLAEPMNSRVEEYIGIESYWKKANMATQCSFDMDLEFTIKDLIKIAHKQNEIRG